MSIVSGNAEIQCVNCDSKFTIDAFDLDVDEVGTEEREMGARFFILAKQILLAPNAKTRLRLNMKLLSILTEYQTTTI